MDLRNPVSSVIRTCHGPVLDVLAAATGPLSGRRVAALTVPSVSDRQVATVLQELAEAGLANRASVPPALQWTLNRDHVATDAVLALVNQWTLLRERAHDVVVTWPRTPFGVYLVPQLETDHDADGGQRLDVLVVLERSNARVEAELTDPASGPATALARDVQRWTGNRSHVQVLARTRLRSEDFDGHDPQLHPPLAITGPDPDDLTRSTR